MIRFLKSLFGWKIIRDNGKTCYMQNSVTGERRVSQSPGGYQPIDKGWVKTGNWTPMGNPPNKSGARHD